MNSKKIICTNCKREFDSKNALFRHLRSKTDSCLSQDELKDFLRHVVNRDENLDKVAVLYGYIPSNYYLRRGLLTLHPTSDVGNQEGKFGVTGGEHAAQLLLEAIKIVSLGSYDDSIDLSATKETVKSNRSYGWTARGNAIVAQDEHTGALTEVLCTRAPPLYDEDESQESSDLKQWLDDINLVLNRKIKNLTSPSCDGGRVKVFGRVTVPKNFNAEMDVNHRRIDYILPGDFLIGTEEGCIAEAGESLQNFFSSLESFCSDEELTVCNVGVGRKVTKENGRTHEGALTNFSRFKRIMKQFCTTINEGDVRPEVSKRKNESGAKGSTQTTDGNGFVIEKKVFTEPIETSKNTMKDKPRTLRRKRFHNFTERAMAHEFLVYRRLDRFSHRRTVQANEISANYERENNFMKRPYVILSLRGDLFLSGQARAIIGLFIAIIRGYIHIDILDCMFDEDYTDLVSSPFVPTSGFYAAEASYMSWEGKMKTILTARPATRYGKGWNSTSVLEEVSNFELEMQSKIVEAWSSRGVRRNTSNQYDGGRRLESEVNWVEEHLKPWSKNANLQLQDYRKWKNAKTHGERILPSLNSVSQTVPELYEKVLLYLKEADVSMLWPSTTPKRQLVMVATNTTLKSNQMQLTVANKNARFNKFDRMSAYSYREGEGGASGTFSVGAMPGEQCEQPKGNKLFPNLMKSAFELEKAIAPHREPSATIAINRNAQFRPHVDSGAGAGQSTR